MIQKLRCVHTLNDWRIIFKVISKKIINALIKKLAMCIFG